MTNISSFMPGQEDLANIKEYLQESSRKTPLDTGARVDYTPLNILLEAPQDYCENRSPQLSEATIINILSPQDDRKISPKPELMYSIKSDGNLKTIIALINETPVFTKNITTNTAEELGSTILDLSNFAAGTYTLTVQAVNTKGFMNRASISVVLQSTDNVPPYFFSDQSKVVATGDSREATLIFNDELSAVVGGTISANGEVIHTFKGRLANFITSAPTVEVEVTDAFENILKETIDISSL